MGAVKSIDNELIAVDDIQVNALRTYIPKCLIEIEKILHVSLCGICTWADEAKHGSAARDASRSTNAYIKMCTDRALDMLKLREELMKLSKFSSKKVL